MLLLGICHDIFKCQIPLFCHISSYFQSKETILVRSCLSCIFNISHWVDFWIFWDFCCTNNLFLFQTEASLILKYWWSEIIQKYCLHKIIKISRSFALFILIFRKRRNMQRNIIPLPINSHNKWFQVSCIFLHQYIKKIMKH
jgi:hypothetical protein